MATALLESPLHRVPTLWSLYRPLLRATRTAPLQFEQRKVLRQYIRDGFKRSKKLGNIEKVKRKWLEAEQLLSQLEGSHHSATHLARMEELARHLLSRSSLPPHPPPPPSSRKKPSPIQPSPRPSILHSTQFAPPMLRLRPQPIGTSMMIFNRRRKSQKRYDKIEIARKYVDDMKEEDGFERRLGRGESEGKWGGEWSDWLREAREKEKVEQARNNMRIPPKLQAKATKLHKKREKRRNQLEGSQQDVTTFTE